MRCNADLFAGDYVDEYAKSVNARIITYFINVVDKQKVRRE